MSDSVENRGEDLQVKCDILGLIALDTSCQIISYAYPSVSLYKFEQTVSFGSTKINNSEFVPHEFS